MSEFVGIRAWLSSDMSVLKRDALLFRRVAIPELTKKVSTGEYGNSYRVGSLGELEWLIEKGIFFDAEDILHNGEVTDEIFAAFVDLTEQQGVMLDKIWNDIPISHKDYQLLCEKNARKIGVQLRTRGLDAYPILSSQLHSVIDGKAEKSDVVQIVLKNLPVPNELVSWEQIIEYRDDPESQDKFLDLRNWMNEVAQVKLTAIEAEQKLEYLVSRYRRHIEAHRMKVNSGVLKTFVITGADFMENLVRLKWGEVAKTLFAISERKITLIEGELNSPGNEVAYVFQTKERFRHSID